MGQSVREIAVPPKWNFKSWQAPSTQIGVVTLLIVVLVDILSLSDHSDTDLYETRHDTIHDRSTSNNGDHAPRSMMMLSDIEATTRSQTIVPSIPALVLLGPPKAGSFRMTQFHQNQTYSLSLSLSVNVRNSKFREHALEILGH